MRLSKTKLIQSALVLIILVSLLFLAQIVSSWTGPTGSAPDNNVFAPINVGDTDQVKAAAIGVDGLAVFGNSILSGASRYLNFGTIPTPADPSSGYGIRDTAGTLEFKNSGGIWASLNTTVQNYLSIGAVTQVKFSDGTTQTTAAAGGGITAVTTASCGFGPEGGCTASCPATYYRTGCSALSDLSYNRNGGSAYPTGTNQCSCTNAVGGTCYAYCAK